MMLEAAPTPCSRTGFHICNSSLWAAVVLPVTGPLEPSQAPGPEAVLHVGSTMIRSPGAAASMALWIVPEAWTWTGFLPPMVTVTVSIDCLPLPAVMTNSPHCAAKPPYCACCCTAQAGTFEGTSPVIVPSFQVTLVKASPPTVTFGQAPVVGHVLGWLPKP